MNKDVMVAKRTVGKAIDRLLSDVLTAKLTRPVYFSQVGANDGQMDDPLYHIIKMQKWHGILFEPVPSYFKKLQTTYSGFEGLTLVNGACGERSETLTFFEIPDEAEVPNVWMKGLSSFNREVVRKHFSDEKVFKEIVVERKIPVNMLDGYFDQYSIKHCDALFIDTEGFERHVILGCDVRKYDTKLVVLEHVHLSKEAVNDIDEYLLGAGMYKSSIWQDSYYFSSAFFGEEISSLLLSLAGGVWERFPGR